MLLELGEARLAIRRDEPEHRAHRELRLVHCRWRNHGSQHIDRRLMNMRGDRRDVVRRELVLFDHGEQRVRGRVRVTTRRVVLERGLNQCPTLAELVSQLGGFSVA